MTILNQTEIVETLPWWCYCLCIVSVILTIPMIAGSIAIKSRGCTIFFSGIFVLTLLAMFFPCISPNGTGRYKYECLIDEKTSFIEIYDKYRVLDRRGDIWVLEDKENEGT